jgi:very-short-patch-repair endonuclease
MSRRRPTQTLPSAPAASDVASDASTGDADDARWVRLVGGGMLCVDHSRIDAVIDAIAGAQRGRVSRRQLLVAGLSGSAIDRRIRSGRLIQVHTGVYAVRPASGEPLTKETEAILRCGHRSLIACHSANVTWGMRKGAAYPVHLLVPRDRFAPKLEGVVVHRSNSLTQRDATIYKGLPITTPERTALDVAATLPDKEVERCVAEGFALNLLTFAKLNAVLARAPNHPGAPTLKRVIASGKPKRTTTTGEFNLLDHIRAAGLPDPQTQHWVLDYQLDFYYPELKLVIEVDGPWHETPWRKRSDAKRDARLKQIKGIDTLRIDPDLDPLAINTLLVAGVTRAICGTQASREAAE